MKNILVFYLKIFSFFFKVNFSVYLNRRVFVMVIARLRIESVFKRVAKADLNLRWAHMQSFKKYCAPA